jgi:hypothetical protein
MEVDMKKRSIGVILPALLLWGCTSQGTSQTSISQTGCNPPASDSQPVALRSQETSMWCWAASGEMVMEFLSASTNVTQCVEANNRFGRTDCCNNPVPGACVVGGWPDFGRHGFTFNKTSNAPLLWDTTREQIHCKKKPFAFTWRWTGGGGHMMVAVGYSTIGGINYVTINDPLPQNVGDQRVITYDAYVSGSGYTHWDDYYDVTK